MVPKVLIENSVFRTWWRPGMTDAEIVAFLDSAGPDERWISIDLINGIGDAQTWIRNCDFVHHWLRNGQQLSKGRSGNAIGFASRNSVWGCNDPWYGSHEFWEHHVDDPAGAPARLFWDRMAAGGMTNLSNDLLFRHIVANCRSFETGAEDSDSTAIRLGGTLPAFPANPKTDEFCRAPVDALAAWTGPTGEGKPAPKPARWAERANLWVALDSVTGRMSPYIDAASRNEGHGISHVFEMPTPPIHPAFR